MARRVVSVDSLVDQLRATEGAPITSERIADLLLEVDLDAASLRPYVHFADDHYTRNLIHRDRHFDIMVLCWQPGQGTPIHNHAGQLGWAFTTSGALEVVDYDRLTPQCEADVGLDGLESGTAVELQETKRVVCTPGGGVSRVCRRVTTHSLTVPRESTERTVSLHVYSLPFDSCVVFDACDGVSRTKPLSFDTVPDGYDVPLRTG